MTIYYILSKYYSQGFLDIYCLDFTLLILFLVFLNGFAFVLKVIVIAIFVAVIKSLFAVIVAIPNAVTIIALIANAVIFVIFYVVMIVANFELIKIILLLN